MDERQPFRGFPEKDATTVRAHVVDKLSALETYVKKLELDGRRVRQRNFSAASNTSSSSSSSRKPPNRFLKRSESLPSTSKSFALTNGSNVNVTGQRSGKKEVPCNTVSIPETDKQLMNDRTAVTNASSVTPSNGPISVPEKVNGKTVDPSPALKASKFRENAEERPKRVNKFLKVPPPSTSPASAKSLAPKKGIESNEESTSEVVVASKGPSDTVEITSKSKGSLQPVQPSSITAEASVVEEAIVNSKMKRSPKTKTSLVEIGPTISSDKKCDVNEVKEIPDAGSSDLKQTDSKDKDVPKPAEKITSKKPVESNKQPIPENEQTQRSKRRIIPNKRFYSDDSETSISLPAVEASNSIPKPSPAKVAVASRNSAPALNAPVVSKKLTPPKSKKRSISGENPKKRKLSKEDGDVAPIKSISPSSKTVAINSAALNPAVATATETAANARPRRTIIPNRKFLSDDEDEGVKEPPTKKRLKEVVEEEEVVVEPQRKRRKSEKDKSVTNPSKKVKVELPDQPLATTCLIRDEPKLENGSDQKEQELTKPGASKSGQSSKSQAPSTPVEVHSNSILPTVATVNVNGDSAKINVNLTEKKEDDVKVAPEDELPLTEDELKLSEETAKILGACILKTADLSGTAVSIGVLCCGVCARLKKYRFFNQKRAKGSFLCLDCINIVDNIFASALNSKPLSCIRGPPVCEGSCPLVFSPPDEFCQACFAKTCLKNLPMKDDVYFKIWRSIPPMSRGCLPTTPAVNPTSPNIGKFVVLNAQGTISGLSCAYVGPKANGNDLKDIDVLNSSEPLNKNDLNSARITTFINHRGGNPSNNCENTVPVAAKGSHQESLPSSELRITHNVKSNGVAQEEILLGRQIGQERVKTLVDPILRPDPRDIETNGFPVIVTGSAYPRKPLCFLCGSAGIDQLIFCSMCCEPYHPYCAGDDLLLNAYISRCDSLESSFAIADNQDRSGLIPDEFSKIVLKWMCRRCTSCKSCKEGIKQHEFIRCVKCQNSYHLRTCVDKNIVSKFKDLRILQKTWICDTCLDCKSCGKKIEFNQRLKAIQHVAANVDVDDEAEGREDKKDNSAEVNVPHNLMLCAQCFKQRKKGSFCPECDVCYDDSDWDSKMIQCTTCKRWIHAECENLSDDQYTIVGQLPEGDPDYDYVCRFCHDSDDPRSWYDAALSILHRGCCSAVRLFESKVIGVPGRKRESVDVDGRPSYVKNLFRNDELERRMQIQDVADVPRDEDPIIPEEFDLAKHMMTCVVKLRDFIRHPKTMEENLYALKCLKVEVLNEGSVPELMTKRKINIPREAKTPIHTTPTKISTPKRQVNSITSFLRGLIGSLKSIVTFQKLFLREIYKLGLTEEKRNALIRKALESIMESFPWFKPPDMSEEYLFAEEAEAMEVEVVPDVAPVDFRASDFTNNPFAEVYWDPTDFFDDRCCLLCGEVGDFPSEKHGRLLWCGNNEWIHCNCAIWSSEVFELETGALQQVGVALNRGKSTKCKACNRKGATVSCCLNSCKNVYHFPCAVEAGCYLLENKTMFCKSHSISEKKQESVQEDMNVGRKVFVDLAWLQKRGWRVSTDDIKVFIGSLKIDCLGSVVPISVTTKDWLEESGAIVTPKNFVAERLFWSLDNPARKESYIFQTSVTLNENLSVLIDVGVNLVVDHSKREASIQNGLDNIARFHQWIKKAPRYIDEDFVDWLTPCHEEFHEDQNDYEELSDNLFISTKRNGRSSPSSVSSFDSFTRAILSDKENSTSHQTYNLRSLPGRIIKPKSFEESSTDGYYSSMDSLSVTSQENSKSSRSPKRRRSSCRTLQKARTRLTPVKKNESPRRRSMRNLHKIETNGVKQSIESDNDSGVASSAAGSCDDERLRCKTNLQFDESLANSPPKEEMVEPNSTSTSDDLSLSSSDGADTSAEQSGLVADQSGSGMDCSTESETLEKMDCSSESENLEKEYRAALKVQIRRNKDMPCYLPCEVRSSLTVLFNDLSSMRGEFGMKSLVRPTQKNLEGLNAEAEYSYRMLGLSHRAVQYLLEQLPDVFKVADQHKFRYISKPRFDESAPDFPLPRHTTGGARSQGGVNRKPFDMFGWLASRHRQVSKDYTAVEEITRNHGLPLATRYRGLGERAKRRFMVLHSEIHGRGLFARCDVERGDMLIEYAGEVIRPSLSDVREKYYESKGIGCYMFRMKTEVIDATRKGNGARFINHSCDPNCEAKTVRISGKDHIIIFALRNIFKGEELTYDYKFEREENKIPCSCGAARCRRYMN